MLKKCNNNKRFKNTHNINKSLFTKHLKNAFHGKTSIYFEVNKDSVITTVVHVNRINNDI